MAEWRENQLPTPTERPEHCVMYFDGSLNLKGVRQQGWPWALLDLGPGLELRPHTAALRRHLRLLLPT
jgi:hypothetical protein